MIIRKPYALLIKNFRLIHFFMLLISGYLLYRIYNALNFFNIYVDTRQFIESSNLVNETVPLAIVLFSFLIIAMSTAIIVLFRKKDKPVFLYFASVIFYIVLIILTVISRSSITTIIIEGIDPRISRIIRDFWLISFFLEIVMTTFYLIRALGFDVKKFHFGEDLNELKIEDEDSEEYELTTRFDADKVKMKAAMRREELKAFYYENRFMILTILILVIIVIPSALIAKNIVSSKRYQEKETIDLKNFEFKVLETYATKKSYNGNVLFSGENSYLVVKFNINNLTEKERGINLNNLRLEIADKVYVPNTTYYDYFTDLGVGYYSQQIKKESKDYIAVYVIKDSDLNNEIVLRYADKVTVKNNQANAKYYRIIIKPSNIDKITNKANLNLNEPIQLNDVKFSITHFTIKDKYTYEYNDKTKYIINSLGLVLSINYTYSSTGKVKTANDFLKNYATLRYVVGSNTYTKKINDITPSTIHDSIYLAVNEEIKDANEIYFVIRLRNTECLYKLK